MASPNDVKKGTVINYENDLWVVVSFQRVSPGKGSSFVRTRMKSLTSGKVSENNFKSSDSLTFEDVMYKKMQYIFSDDISLTFMDGGTYEQVALDRDVVGDDAKFLKEGLEVIVIMHDEKAVSMELPLKIEYTVTVTEPASKGDTVSGNVQKDATMDNGLVVRVPIFINQGDVIKVNTENGQYVERVKQ
ncbi:MAG: elongation factor P [Patescibacteria group bacterium]|jgi:elongation factor P